MTWDEIEVPKEIRPFMLEHAEETRLGQKKGANKQYRYDRLHIREYDEKYLIHMDNVDPRKDPIGHLIFDAPEVLIGLASALISGREIVSQINERKKSKKFSFGTVFLTSIALGYMGYYISKKAKIF